MCLADRVLPLPADLNRKEPLCETEAEKGKRSNKDRRIITNNAGQEPLSPQLRRRELGFNPGTCHIIDLPRAHNVTTYMNAPVIARYVSDYYIFTWSFITNN